MGRRNALACDTCHRLKLKCTKSISGCSRCNRLAILCRYERVILRPGRKPASCQAYQYDGEKQIEYPVLDVLLAFGVRSEKPGTGKYICSRADASRLLEHLFSSPNQEFHTRIIRRHTLLNFSRPRPTSPSLLFTLLCVSCYMPTVTSEPVLPALNYGEHMKMRRSFLSNAVELLQPLFLGKVESTFDDALAVYMLTAIAISEEETHSYLPQWLDFCKFLVKQMNLFIEPNRFDEESKEERRRLWWATWIGDRHSALSFNLRTQLTELECQNLQRPYPDSIWELDSPLEPLLLDHKQARRIGVDTEIQDLDLFGIFIPLASIIGDIVEYHFLRQHRAFGSSAILLDQSRQIIEQNLEQWIQSLDRKIGLDNSAAFEQADDCSQTDAHPPLTIYARHMYHCLHILLFGQMDLVQMYYDSDWLSSPDFIKAGEHAGRCSKIAKIILEVDPRLHLCYRFFGTYLLQSSFLFLILAQKFGQNADDNILDNCRKNLCVLDAFVRTVNIGYQRTFARVLRRTLLMNKGNGTAGIDNNIMQPLVDDGISQNEEFDPEVLKYRWTAGYNGLWLQDMGRPREAMMRKFPGQDDKSPKTGSFQV